MAFKTYIVTSEVELFASWSLETKPSSQAEDAIEAGSGAICSEHICSEWTDQQVFILFLLLWRTHPPITQARVLKAENRYIACHHIERFLLS